MSGIVETEKALDPTEGIETAEGMARLAAGLPAPDSAPEPKKSVLDGFAEAAEEMRSKGILLLCPIPGHPGLVGRFTKMTKPEKATFAKGMNSPPPGLSKEQKDLRTMCLRIAIQCRELTWQGKPIEGSTAVSGFTHELGQKIRVQPIEGGTREPDSADIVWRVVGCDEEALLGLMRVVVKWSTNPTHRDLSDADPFVGI